MEPEAAPTGEFALLARLSRYLRGAGDDAAVLDFGGARVVAAADAVVEGRHFRRELSSLADVGWKALAVNVSDLAAMGAVRPRAALVALLLPSGTPAQDVEALYEGMSEAAGRYGMDIVGGDTTAADQLAVAVTVLGEAHGPVVPRSGARPGDRLVLVGRLGWSAAALAQWAAGAAPSPSLLAAHRRPRALPDAGRVLAEQGARALIDVSDGLGQDAGHLCAASGVRMLLRWTDLAVDGEVADAAAAAGVDLEALVCGGGEDYALLAVLPPEAADTAARAAAAAEGLPARVVGEVLAAGGEGPIVGLERADGTVGDIGGLGWDHFREQGSP